MYEFVSNKTHESFSPQVSTQYADLVRAVQSSRYHQSDVTKACVFIPPIDTLNFANLDADVTSALLNSLPTWNGGSNHLIFSMIPGAHPSFLETPSFYYGKAMLAGGSFSMQSYRAGFDVSTPVFNALTQPTAATVRRDTSIPQRPRLLTVLASGAVPSTVAWQLDSLIHRRSTDDVLVLESCSPGRVSHDQLPWKRCKWNSNEVVDYLEALQQSRFCVLLPSARRGAPELLDVLMTGCVPVITDLDYVLPFSEVLDWTLASVTCWSHDLAGVGSLLESLSEDTVRRLQEQAIYFYDRYFASMATITVTTLDIINERVYPLSIRGYKWWNSDSGSRAEPSPLLPAGGSSLSSASLQEGFTAVILTYDRVPMLFQVITSIAAAPSLHKILIIWNNLNKAPPPTDEWPKISKPIQVILSQQNKLSNRFLPYPEIETAAVFALDDDITMLTTDELEFGFKAWQEFPSRLVGFPGRVHWLDRGKWQYESNWLNNISLILTGAAFYHKYYHNLYTHEMSPEVRDWVDAHMNCEDIAMNFLVAQHTGLPPLKVSPRKKFKCASCVSEESLWNDPSHYQERNECINIFARLFRGGMPLKTVKFRLDPVLYGDSIDSRFKSYSNMGEL